MNDFRVVVLAVAGASIITAAVVVLAMYEAGADARVSSCLSTAKDSCACLSIHSLAAAEACYEAKGAP